MLVQSHTRAQHWRQCPDCTGRGRWQNALQDPTGSVPHPRVMVVVQCDTCKGEGRVRMWEQWREKGKLQVRDYTK